MQLLRQGTAQEAIKEGPSGLQEFATGDFRVTMSQGLGQLSQVGLQEGAGRGQSGWLVWEVVWGFSNLCCQVREVP